MAAIMKVNSTGGPRLSRLCWAEVEAVAVPSVTVCGTLTSPLLASEDASSRGSWSFLLKTSYTVSL